MELKELINLLKSNKEGKTEQGFLMNKFDF